jgi:hypothetical protein
VLFNILTLIHVLSGLSAIGSGARVLYEILDEELIERWAVIFLRCTLLASVTGLFFPMDHFLPTHWNAMLSVYVSCVAVLAWRKSYLSRNWNLAFTLSVIAILFMDILLAIAHIFTFVPVLAELASTRSWQVLLIDISIMLSFAALGVSVIIRKEHGSTVSLKKQKALKRARQKSTVPSSTYVTQEDWYDLFIKAADSFFVLSFLLTANHEEAEQCIESAREDCVDGVPVFQESARAWARRAIVRNAIRLMANRCNPLEEMTGEAHRKSDSTSLVDVPCAKVLTLEDFERIVYVLTVHERYSEQECSCLLGSSCRNVREARMRALQQIAARLGNVE